MQAEHFKCCVKRELAFLPRERWLLESGNMCQYKNYSTSLHVLSQVLSFKGSLGFRVSQGFGLSGWVGNNAGMW